jgi:hypothetical protein
MVGGIGERAAAGAVDFGRDDLIKHSDIIACGIMELWFLRRLGRKSLRG